MAIAGQVTAAALRAVREAAIPGVSLDHLNRLAHRVIVGAGCAPSFLGYHGYPASICASPNDVIVHGIPTDYRLTEGDILSIDAGAVHEGFHGDAAFTIAIGTCSQDAARLIAATERALWAGIRAVREGSRVGDIGAVVQAVGVSSGLGVVREYVGHGIGRQMHEEPQVPNYGVPGKGTKLRVGMALCIEPMFNLGTHETSLDADGWTVRTADGSLSAHFEHTVALTPDGIKVTTLSDDERTRPDLVSVGVNG